MKGTIKIAQQFEDAIGKLWDGDSNDDLVVKCLAVYSCDALGGRHPAVSYLNRVAPDVSRQLAAFGKYSDSDYIRGCSFCGIQQANRTLRMKIQMQRALWLTMLAELAEQGEEFPDDNDYSF